LGFIKCGTIVDWLRTDKIFKSYSAAWIRGSNTCIVQFVGTGKNMAVLVAFLGRLR